jgi:serine/threonine protein kinase
VRNDGLLILIDFDLAMERKPKPVKVSPLPGTFAYLPPETLSRSLVDDQTDIYSFGVTCYELLTGHKPFEGVTLEDSQARRRWTRTGRPPASNSTMFRSPWPWRSLIFKCLAYRQEDRYPSMSLVMRDLETMV